MAFRGAKFCEILSHSVRYGMYKQLSSTQNYFYPIKLQDFGYLHVFTIRVENSVDPDQLASEKPADQDLHF